MARSEDLIMMTPAQLRALTTKELRAVTQQLADAANKRIKRLLADEIGSTSPILRRGKGGEVPYYSVKGKTDRGDIMAEYKRLRNVLRPSAKTSSVTAWKKESAKITERAGGFMTFDMWAAYREIEGEYGGNFPGGYDSTEVQRLIVKIKNGVKETNLITFGDDNFTSYYDSVRRKIDVAYRKEMEDREKREKDEIYHNMRRNMEE